MENHWVVYKTDEPFMPNLDKFGFVYIITNTKTGKAYGKAYVGCKQYFLGKSKKKMKWETYMSSSKYLKADIEKIGKKHFKFEVIAEYKNKRSLRYYEAYYQMKWDVLTATMKDSDDPAFYNSYVGGKWYRPIESYTPHTEETKRKMSISHLTSESKPRGKNHKNYKGKVELYLDGKRIEIDCIASWCRENGYDNAHVSGIARTTRDGFVIDRHDPKGKRKKLSCKGPLGIITKVRWLNG
jgi:hypothetical protein